MHVTVGEIFIFFFLQNYNFNLKVTVEVQFCKDIQIIVACLCCMELHRMENIVALMLLEFTPEFLHLFLGLKKLFGIIEWITAKTETHDIVRFS